MKTLVKIFFVLITFISLGGCSINGPYFSELAPAIKTMPSNTGRIYFYRYTDFGEGQRPDIKINDEIAGKAIDRGFFFVDKAPGKYEIMNSYEAHRKIWVTLEKGQTIYISFKAYKGYYVDHVYPELVSPETGLAKIQKCRYTGNQIKAIDKNIQG